MIQRFDIHFIHSEHDDNLKKYVTRKIGHLDKYLPRHARTSAHAEVNLKEGKTGRATTGRDCSCEVTLHLPHEVINVRETSVNMYAAVDIIELKLKQKIQKYKETQPQPWRRRVINRITGITADI